MELIKITERFGSTGVEIDVRLTKDNVPVLYHDGGLNLRLTQKGPMVGPVEDYTLAELKSFVWLINGERIPTLEEALDAVVTQTNLKFVWLDTKTEQSGVITAYVPIVKKALQKAASMGRDLEICAGIPTQEVLDEFLAYPNYQNIPSLCELTPENVRTVNARVWGPRWTMGTQNDQVRRVPCRRTQGVYVDAGRSALHRAIHPGGSVRWYSHQLSNGCCVPILHTIT